MTASERNFRAALGPCARETNHSPGPVRKPTAQWLKPQLLADVEYRPLISDGKLRHPSFQGLREELMKNAAGMRRNSRPPCSRRLQRDDACCATAVRSTSASHCSLPCLSFQERRPQHRRGLRWAASVTDSQRRCAVASLSHSESSMPCVPLLHSL